MQNSGAKRLNTTPHNILRKWRNRPTYCHIIHPAVCITNNAQHCTVLFFGWQHVSTSIEDNLLISRKMLPTEK
jgi:hypothetical protein